MIVHVSFILIPIGRFLPHYQVRTILVKLTRMDMELANLETNQDESGIQTHGHWFLARLRDAILPSELNIYDNAT